MSSIQTPQTPQQCDAAIAAVRARIVALSQEAVMRAQMITFERNRNIHGIPVPQADWIAMLEADRAVQEQQSRDAQAELATLVALRATLLAEQQQQQPQ